MQNLKHTPFLSSHRLPVSPSGKNADPAQIAVPSKGSNGCVNVSVLHFAATTKPASAAEPLVKKLNDAANAQSSAKGAATRFHATDMT